jgi:hypothetical protein
VGYNAPRLSVDYDAQTAKNTAKQADLTVKIEQHLQKLANKKGEALVIADI